MMWPPNAEENLHTLMPFKPPSRSCGAALDSKFLVLRGSFGAVIEWASTNRFPHYDLLYPKYLET